jgi:hypothetical protein
MDGDWKSNWESMTIDDLFILREQVHEILRERLNAKRAELDRIAGAGSCNDRCRVYQGTASA